MSVADDIETYTPMTKEEAWRRYQELASFYYPYYFGSEDQSTRMDIIRVMSDEFTPSEITAEEKRAESAATMTPFAYAFLKFGDAAEVYDKRIGAHEFDGLSKEDSTEEYEAFKGKAKSAARDKLETIGGGAAFATLPLLIVTGILALTKISRTVIWILLGVWVLLRMVAFIGLPVDHLLYLPRKLRDGFLKGYGIFKPISALLFLALGIVGFAITPLSVYLYKDTRLRREKKYQDYKFEHLQKRYAKIVEKVREYWKYEGAKVSTVSKGYAIYERDPSYYKDRVKYYWDLVLRQHPLWYQMLIHASEDAESKEKSHEKLLKRDDRLRKLDEWAAYDEINGFAFYDEIYMSDREEHYAEKENKSWNRVDDAKSLLRFIEKRILFEAIFLLSRNDFNIQ